DPVTRLSSTHEFTIKDDHGNTTDTATKINLNETIKARIDYTFDNDVFEISEAEKLRTVVIVSPNKNISGSYPMVNGIEKSVQFTFFENEGLHYSVVNSIKNNKYELMDKARFMINYNILNRQLGEYEFTTYSLTEEQMRYPEVNDIPNLSAGETIDLTEYVKVFNGFVATPRYFVSGNISGNAEVSADGILTAKKSGSSVTLTVTDPITRLATVKTFRIL
ncbi:hypothetical protein, partial [Enterococcus sp. LJL51]|uniref:hypothetical protein n=1 Tax=Enterococcus sp. LJL51 TaxID=3416656 RepID=UPI003CF003A6